MKAWKARDKQPETVAAIYRWLMLFAVPKPATFPAIPTCPDCNALAGRQHSSVCPYYGEPIGPARITH